MHLESKISGKPHVFCIHPNEFIDESNEKRIINRRSHNFMSYFLADYLRAKLKGRNLGQNALEIYEKIITFYFEEQYSFVTVKDLGTRYKNGSV